MATEGTREMAENAEDSTNSVRIEIELTESEAAKLIISVENQASRLDEDSEIRLELELLADRLNHAVKSGLERKYGFNPDGPS
jgi:hypothetical protein